MRGLTGSNRERRIPVERTAHSRCLAMLPVSGYLRSALLWAMIPLTVFASRPVTGCTCGSGEYKFSCSVHLFRGNAQEESGGATCQKACCRGQTNVTHSMRCCQSGHCPLSDIHGKDGKKCCNPDQLTAATPPTLVTFSVDNEHHVLFDIPVLESGNIFPDLTIADVVHLETGPPGGDLVISLRRLLV